MSYQVLARKWRPRDFSQMIGQEHVVKILSHALNQQRLHHAYLFTGTRGVGKTTLARILAKALNCENGVSATPCSQCLSCQELDEGRFIDLIEVDGASRTKVEDIRDLLENAQYMPSKGRYKVYLIDEVHMLSLSSFNALLKTLEEPPEHVKFLLATTDPQKLPATVLSRCLQFNLTRLLPAQLTSHFAHILTQEQIEYEAEALPLLAKAADGSVRDGLSLLDQAINFCAGKINCADLHRLLGSLPQETSLQLLQAIADNQGLALWQQLQALTLYTPDFNHLLADMLAQLQHIALVQCVPDSVSLFETQPLFLALAQQLSPQDVQLLYQIALLGRRDLSWSPDAQTGFTMVLLRMLAFQPSHLKTEQPVTLKNEPKQTVAPVLPTEALPADLNQQWAKIVNALNLSALVKQLADNAVLYHWEDPKMHLLLPSDKSFLLKRQEQLRSALNQYFNHEIQLHIKVQPLDKAQISPVLLKQQHQHQQQQQAEQTLAQDENLHALRTTLGAVLEKIIPPTE